MGVKMKTKNVKVRLKDVKQGVTVYTAHPVYGIDIYRFESKPYWHPSVGSLFVKVSNKYGETTKSLRDMGVYSAYNGRRTFFKLKHAEAWMKKWSKSKSFIADHKRHEEWCASMEWYGDPYDDDPYYEDMDTEEYF